MKGHEWGVSRRMAGGSRCRALPSFFGTMPRGLDRRTVGQGTQCFPQTAPILRFGTHLPGHGPQMAAQRHFRVAVATFLPGRPKLRRRVQRLWTAGPLTASPDTPPHSAAAAPTRTSRERCGARRAACGVRVRRRRARDRPRARPPGPVRPPAAARRRRRRDLALRLRRARAAGRPLGDRRRDPAPAFPHRGRAPAPAGRALRARLVHGLGGEGRRRAPPPRRGARGAAVPGVRPPAGRGMQGHWKLAAIDEHAGPDRPLAWIDDAFTPACDAWARGAPGRRRCSSPRSRSGPHRGPRRAARGLGGRAPRRAGGLAAAAAERRPRRSRPRPGRPRTRRGPARGGPSGTAVRRRERYWRSPPPSSGTSRSASSSAKPGSVAAGADVLERREVLVERGAEAAQAVAVAEPELGRDLVLVEQADVVDRARQRLGRLDLDPPVALEPRRGRDQLADDHVLLQPVEACPSCPRARRRSGPWSSPGRRPPTGTSPCSARPW